VDNGRKLYSVLGVCCCGSCYFCLIKEGGLMNIIKAGKALQAGKVVADESGFEYKAENDGGSRVLIRAFGSGEWQPAELFLRGPFVRKMDGDR
jgi:hypothetical protein